MKKVTVVIPNWNGMAYLKICLDSLRNQDTDDFSVLVIDNASQDGSVEFIREQYPEVRLEVMEENLGFSGGVNAGILLSETPYVILLNNDVETDRAYVSSMIRAIEKDERIFSVSSRMVNFRERDLLDDCGDIYTVFGWQAQRGVGQKVTDPKYLKPCEVFSACAGAAIYRRNVFDEIGLFDRMHFAYLEDIDIGYRAKIYGYRNMYEPTAVVYHIGSGASGAVKYSDFKVRISARNSVYLIRKNMSPLQQAVNALPLAAGRFLKKRFFRKLGFEKAYTEGIREGRETARNAAIVPYRLSHVGNYLRIEGLLIRYTFVYMAEYLKRSGKTQKGEHCD